MPDNTNGRELHPMILELARGQNFAATTTLLPSGHPQTLRGPEARKHIDELSHKYRGRP
jgi:hypothetical protein